MYFQFQNPTRKGSTNNLMLEHHFLRFPSNLQSWLLNLAFKAQKIYSWQFIRLGPPDYICCCITIFQSHIGPQLFFHFQVSFSNASPILWSTCLRYCPGCLTDWKMAKCFMGLMVCHLSNQLQCSELLVSNPVALVRLTLTMNHQWVTDTH